VRGPLLLPSDYIRKYFFFNLEVFLFVFYFGASGCNFDSDFYYSCDSGAV
jgi:hypothetical protein